MSRQKRKLAAELPREYEIAPREVGNASRESWVSEARRVTALPVYSETGELVRRDAEGEAGDEEKARRKETAGGKETSEGFEKSGREKKSSSKRRKILIVSSCLSGGVDESTILKAWRKSPHLSPREASSLSNQLAGCCQLDPIGEFAFLAETAAKVSESPEANLYLMELSLAIVKRTMMQRERFKRKIGWEESAVAHAMSERLVVQLLAVGMSLKSILPAYVVKEMRTTTADEDKSKGVSSSRKPSFSSSSPKKHQVLSKEVKRMRHHESYLMDVYKRYLCNHLFICLRDKSLWGNFETTICAVKLLTFISNFLETALGTNFQNEVFQNIVLFANECHRHFCATRKNGDENEKGDAAGYKGEDGAGYKRGDAAGYKQGDAAGYERGDTEERSQLCAIAITEALDVFLGSIRDAIRRDLTLSWSVSIANKVTKMLLSEKRHKEYDDEMWTPLHGILACFHGDQIEKLENEALSELRRRGALDPAVNLSKVKKITTKQKRSAEIMKEVFSDLTPGLIHGDIRKFRENKTTLLTDLFVFALKVLKCAHLYSKSTFDASLLIIEQFSENINVEMAVEIFGELKKLCGSESLSGCLILSSVSSALNIYKKLIKGDATTFDLSWIGTALAKAALTVYEEELLDKFVHTTRTAVGLPRVFSVTSEPAASMVMALSSLLPHISMRNQIKLIELLKDYAHAFPSLSSIFTLDGILLSTTSGAETCFWNLHMAQKASSQRLTVT